MCESGFVSVNYTVQYNWCITIYDNYHTANTVTMAT